MKIFLDNFITTRRPQALPARCWRRRSKAPGLGFRLVELFLRRQGRPLWIKNARSPEGFALAHQSSGGGLDPLLELGHQPPARPSGRYRFEELEDDPAATFDKASSPPEEPGVDRGRNHRQRQRLVQSSDAGLIGKMLPRRDSRSLREDDDRPSFGGDWPRLCDHAAQRAGPGLAVDRDRAGARRVPAVERDEQKPTLQHHRAIAEDHGKDQGVPRRLVLHRDDAAAAGHAVEAPDLMVEPDDDPEQEEHAARPKPAEAHRRWARRQEKRQPDRAQDRGPGEKRNVERERPDPADHLLSASGASPLGSGRSISGRNRAARYFAYSPDNSAAVPGHAHQRSCLTWSGKTG